jgi:hypothetical protein
VWEQIKSAVVAFFVGSFPVVMLIGAGLAVCSAVSAAVLVEGKPEHAEQEDDERPHHVVVFVLEQVAVVHVAAGEAVEGGGDRYQLPGVDPHRVLPAGAAAGHGSGVGTRTAAVGA